MSSLDILRIDSRQKSAHEAIGLLRQRLSPQGNVVSPAGRQRTINVFGQALSPQQVVERICHDVQQQGMPALLDYCRRIDKAELTADSLRVPEQDLHSAHNGASDEFLKTIRRIRDNIFEFQTAILAKPAHVQRGDDVYLAQRYVPLRRVGLCVPGGAAAYPSTVLMTAVPAQAAGVKELVVVAPPTPFGAYNTDLLATCHELGIREVYRMGGAQAVAALAYGVEGIAQVDKIVGPGSLFVALAKKRVFGDVDIDSIAGPSEVVVLADSTTRADFTAADLIAQAEHAPGASLLISWSEPLIDQTLEHLEQQLATLARGDLARSCLEEFGAMILVRDAEEAMKLTNQIAPEHLHIACANADALLEGIESAGAVFLGSHSPVAVGDYIAGPSHVLPTGGTARFASGLSANDFLRTHSVIRYTEAGLEDVADDIRRIATTEGLTAHARSVDIRFDAK